MNVPELQRTLAPLLTPLAVGYRALMKLRRFLWETGFLNRLNPACPCISIGNIAWGGTGKTPVVDWLLGWASRNGLKSAVLSRGYKADLSIAPVYVKSHHTAHDVGDEPLMLALDHPDAAILVDPNRRRSGRYALERLKPDLMLLDDGMQHLAVRRNLELVLLRPEDVLEQWERGIPVGSWREGASALERADAFLFKSSPRQMQELLPAIQSHLAVFKKPVFSFSMRPVRLEAVTSTAVLMPQDMHDPYVLISGVGSPAQVASTVEDFMGAAPEKHLVFSDHHSYTFKDGEHFANLKMPIICTRKDAVKLRLLPIRNLWTIRTIAQFETSLWSSLAFPEWMNEWWQRQMQPGSASLSGGSSWSGFVPGQGLQAHQSVSSEQKLPQEDFAKENPARKAEDVDTTPPDAGEESSGDAESSQPAEAPSKDDEKNPDKPAEPVEPQADAEEISESAGDVSSQSKEREAPVVRSTVPGVVLGVSSGNKS